MNHIFTRWNRNWIFLRIILCIQGTKFCSTTEMCTVHYTVYIYTRSFVKACANSIACNLQVLPRHDNLRKSYQVYWFSSEKFWDLGISDCGKSLKVLWFVEDFVWSKGKVYEIFFSKALVHYVHAPEKGSRTHTVYSL